MEALRERFGKYHVLEKIAQGGMAEVYKVKTVGIAGFEKVQALKRILPQQAREGRFVRSFIDEARIAVELTHRNIVQVFDFGRADGELFLAMELIEGKDLRTALGEGISRERLPPVPVAAHIIAEVAAGLDYAHRKTDGYGGSLGIVHCDVSPSNVMLSADGYVKILDFGIARATFSAALERRRLRGKPRYMAPEQTIGEAPTTAADVFALGIIAWELFTGTPLYRGRDIKQILDAVRNHTPPRIDRINPAVPREIVDAVERALQREPAQRNTAADLVAACARTAMAASARALSAWLAELDASQPVRAAVLEPEGTGAVPVEAPQRHSARSITQSLAGGPGLGADLAELGGFGYGTPPLRERIETEPIAKLEAPPERPSLTVVSYAEPDDEPVTTYAPRTPAYEELAVEDEAPPAPPDEPIDDDLGALAVAPSERRRIVIVAAQLAGAPADALRPIAQQLGELAYQRGGVELACEDDALVVAFGLEVAGEDDVAIAMGWALDAIALARDADPEGVVLRVGARTGVSTSAPDGAEAARVPPDAIEEARGLARDAAPEKPLFVGAAGRLTSGLYELREVPPARRIARRGKLLEVVGLRGFEERGPGRLARRGKLFGRTAALAELDVWVQRAIAADRRLTALVTGAAGTGKSRLVAELIARRTEAGTPMQIVITGASPATRLAPFSLVIDLYQAALGLPPARGRSARALVVKRLLHLLGRAGVPADRARDVAMDLDRAMELRDGFGVGAPEVADLRPRISAGLAAFRGAMYGRGRPGLTIIEDLHLADSASLEVMRHTLLVPAASPELLVLTARPEGTPPPACDVVIPLGDLVGAELRALISDRLGDAASPLTIAAVLARAGGNPLFVEELAQAVRDAGAGEDVPATAREVVSARIDRLSPKARTALRAAAVLGGTVRARLLEELLGEQGAGGEDTFDAGAHAIDELVDAGFLVRTSDADLAFARGLVREVVYESLSARSLREAHARVGRLLASRFFAGREEPPAVVAEHLERGGELAGAAAFWLRAGSIALTASDADAAIAAFTRTIDLERELGATPPTPASRTRRREALSGREEARRLQGDLASDAGDLDELQRLCEGEPGRLADVAIRRAQRMLRIGDYATATAATVVAEGHAMAARDDLTRGEAFRIRGEILERQGRFDDALGAVEQARALFHARGALPAEMAAMVGRGRIHLMRAHYEQAHEAYQPVNALIDRTGDPWLERIVKNHVAVIEMCLGHFDVAMASALRSLELCRRYGDRAREGDALSVAGIILLEVGLFDQAAARFSEALAILSRTASRWSRADCLIYYGTCDVMRGRAGGTQMIDEALGEARRLGARYLEANALVARAGADLVKNDLGSAIAYAAEGVRVARDATLVGYEIQGLARLALALVRQGGRPADGLALVDRAMALVERQPYLEGSEEEVYWACAEVAEAAGARDRAAALVRAGRRSAQRKLDALTDPAWQRAFSELPAVEALLRG